MFSDISAQKGGTVRGHLYNENTGEPIIYATVVLETTNIGANTDEEGFFSIGNIPPGTYNLLATYIGFDSIRLSISLSEGRILTQNILMRERNTQLVVVDVSAKKEKSRSEIQISSITLSSSQIKSLPGAGGQTDLAQFLPVLPGIVSSGDQGGQIYIRGGSPVQNQILLDGMTIYNPFHSIGFFSVFETEAIKTVDVLTAGFNAEYGGRVSAVLDIRTRDGNKKKLSGLIVANPFQAKALLEGPLKKFRLSGGSSSFLLTAKRSFIDKTSSSLYKYAVDTGFYSFRGRDTLSGSGNLPFAYTDIFGKASFATSNGSKISFFGFSFMDEVDYAGVARLGWNVAGGGTNFSLIPSNSNLIIGGSASFSSYTAQQSEPGNDNRKSGINTYSIHLNFSYFGLRNELKYGIEVAGLDTDFKFRNFIGNTIRQDLATTELAGFVRFNQKLGNFLFEPSLRVQFYPSVPATSFEPRFGAKWLLSDNFRAKVAAGLYSQNLIGTVNEQDVVNLFVGYLAGTDERVLKPDGISDAPHRIQKAVHAVAGLEMDVYKALEVNVEAYLKRFTQLIQLNRNKLKTSDPNFVTETGTAFGTELSLNYNAVNWYLYNTLTLAFANRNNGIGEYPTVFDRRVNLNLLGALKFGQGNNWEAALRWNFGTGFPFTLTQGFFNSQTFAENLTFDPRTGNGSLGLILHNARNAGRLPAYHRMDVSLKRNLSIGKYLNLEAVVAVTNLYNRDNIFFYDRVSNRRINQLPVLPSLGITLRF